MDQKRNVITEEFDSSVQTVERDLYANIEGKVKPVFHVEELVFVFTNGGKLHV